MRVVLAHNRYEQRGGEDVVFAAEAALLRRFGHEVIEFVKDNRDIDYKSRLALFKSTVWSSESYAEFAHLIQARRPDVVHFHNTLPLISPSAAHAAKAQGAATVQTLHNYRLVCPSALMFRNGRPCEDCVGKRFAWPGILHACYRDSRPATAAVATMIAVHRALATWSDKIDRHIALTEFSRKKLIAGGLPAERVIVKPNFLVSDPGPGEGEEGFAAYVGRLSAEKGVTTLLAAWRRIDDRLPLKIIGDGPLREMVAAAAAEMSGVSWLGEREHEDVLDLIGRASVLVFPSEWYEPFGLGIIEAFAKGTPVIGADIGSISTLIDDGRTGFLFPPGNSAELAARIDSVLARPDVTVKMRRAARRTFEQLYTAERNYGRLMQIYEAAIESNRRRRSR